MYAKYLRTKDDEVFKKFATLRNKLRKKTRELLATMKSSMYES